MNTLTRTKQLLPILFLAAATSPALAGTCSTDLDGDGGTGFSDLTAMLNAWGPCVACPADVNGDGNVGFADLTELLNSWGPCPIVDVFDYPEYANQFALVVGQQYLDADGPIALPQETYDRMDRDMGLILAAHPELDGSSAMHMWRWEPFALLVGIDTDLPSDDFDAALAYYQGEITDSFSGGSTLFLDFPLGANPHAMIPIFTELDSVEYAEVNSLVTAGLNPRWEPTDVGADTILWKVVVGWDNGDLCNTNSSPCECFTTYEFVIQPDGTMTTPFPVESVPSPWNPDATCDGYPPTP